MRTRWLLTVVLVVLGAMAAWLWSGDGARDAVAPTANAPAAPDPVAASGGSDATPPVLPPAPAATQRSPVAAATPGLAGRVVQDSRPLAGAELRAMIDYGRDLEIGRATADVDGSFFLPLPDGRYRLAVAGASVPQRCMFGPVTLVPGEHCDLGDLAVPVAASVRGRVVDERGAPMADTRVACVLAGDSERQRYQILDPASPLASPSAVSGADGRFVIGGLMAGNVHVDARHPDCWGSEQAELTAGACADIGDLVLMRSAPLRGFVFDQGGAPVEGACVMPGGSQFNATVAWRTVRTAADGGFELRGMGGIGQFGVAKDGYEPLLCERLEPGQPLRLVLHKSAPLAGVVLGGNGKPGTLRIETPDYRDWPWWVDRVLYTPQPIAADGSFRVAGLPAGSWQVSARIPGVGSVAPEAVELPLVEPMLLQLVPDLDVAVAVVDDLGAPVAGATLARVHLYEMPSLPLADLDAVGRTWCGYGSRDSVTADAAGKAVVRVPAHAALTLAATGPQHLFTAVAAHAGAVPATIDLVLPRGGVLSGSIADASLLTQVHAYVGCRRVGGDKDVAGMGLDHRGSFRSRPLPPGSYTVALYLSDAAHPSTGVLPLAAAVPLLGDFQPVCEPVAVEVLAGVETRVDLPSPRCGEVQGRVFAGGAPLASAIVYGRNQAVPAFGLGKPEFPGAFTSFPYCRTDTAGRFRFLVGTAGTFELRARHPLGAAWSEPVVLQLSRESHLQRDLLLHAAAIRGSFDVSGIAPKERSYFTAQLYRLQDAGEDPFASGDWTRSQEWQVAKAPLGKTGSFAFECLPPGGYVLRLVRPWQQILLTRVLHTTGDEVLDLGALELPKCRAPQLACGLQPEYGVWVRLAAEGSKDGVFVRAVLRGPDDKLDWGELVPGHYRLKAFRQYEFGPGAMGISGDPVGGPFDVEVHDDGSCTPSVVWPDGIKG